MRAGLRIRENRLTFRLQLFTVARALLQDAPIVVPDKATGFADAENEHKIKKTFSQLLKNKTVIMIAHRLSSICECGQNLRYQ